MGNLFCTTVIRSYVFENVHEFYIHAKNIRTFTNFTIYFALKCSSQAG